MRMTKRQWELLQEALLQFNLTLKPGQDPWYRPGEVDALVALLDPRGDYARDPEEPRKYRYVATFDSQAWLHNCAFSVDPQGDTEWDCTPELIAPYIQGDGTLGEPFSEVYRGAWLDEDDILRGDPAAPEWVREWQGPFTITVRRVKS